MHKEREQIIEYLRSELVGPTRPILDFEGKDIVKLDVNKSFNYPEELPGQGIPLFWRPSEEIELQEIIHYRNESPLNHYGAGLLFPAGAVVEEIGSSDLTGKDDSLGDESLMTDSDPDLHGNEESTPSTLNEDGGALSEAQDDDFEIANANIYRPSTIGISFCVPNNASGKLIFTMPSMRKFAWQGEDSEPFQVNGRYEKCEKVLNLKGTSQKVDAWRRCPAVQANSVIEIEVDSLRPGQVQNHFFELNPSTTFNIQLQLFPRIINEQWVITAVVRNNLSSIELKTNESKIRSTLFQAYFEVKAEGFRFDQYPEGLRPFEDFDSDEQTLALLYRDCPTWAIGHGCSAGWDLDTENSPSCIYADVMPAVELPSMTPDITDSEGQAVSISMRELAELSDNPSNGGGWDSLVKLEKEYALWITDNRNKKKTLASKFSEISSIHLDSCDQVRERIARGIEILKYDEDARQSFRLANKAMLFQQIASKQLKKRALKWNGEYVEPAELAESDFKNPLEIYEANAEKGVGNWRAFQIAYFLMSLDGLVNESSCPDRDVVDLIWFPTGGGKTEAYLSVISFYLFHERLKMEKEPLEALPRDGTNVFMRYTLRMLTTQQFQRAASLICAMDVMRKKFPSLRLGKTSFSMGLWIGGSGSPNKISEAKTALNKYKKDGSHGNPLVLTECPWCKSEIGRLSVKPSGVKDKDWRELCVAGFGKQNNEPVLKCSDITCDYGGEFEQLPIEVIDERIYRNPPSLFIATADKFAMMAYRPEAGALFGRKHNRLGEVEIVKRPPGLIIQDEFHLISGPLGTIYGLYEGVIEELCSIQTSDGKKIKPKLVASTATIRGADKQVRSVFAREQLQLFPSPGLSMDDSFFGKYHRQPGSNKLSEGRLYLGIHAQNYGSFLTAQVRAFTSLLFRAWFFDEDKKDPWWTLLVFYNSLRELGGARTLFNSDIYSRLKNYFFRYFGPKAENQRYLNYVEELTSRKTQAELVAMMDRLGQEYGESDTLDACLASSIIEVGVDIERLALMAVVGQPKSTAQYIQVTGRVGRRWYKDPGLILSMYNPAKSRDRSHFEQFFSYHSRLYEQVEPTSATPFSLEALNKALHGALLLYARQYYDSASPTHMKDTYSQYLFQGRDLLLERAEKVVDDLTEQQRVRDCINEQCESLIKKWGNNPQQWEEYPQKTSGEYLMLWPGQLATKAHLKKGSLVLSSMRNVDESAYMSITTAYAEDRED